MHKTITMTQNQEYRKKTKLLQSILDIPSVSELFRYLEDKELERQGYNSETLKTP